MTRRPPGWMYLVLVPWTSYVLFTWGVLAFGPEEQGYSWGDAGVVEDVQPGLAADRAGVREGDTVVTVNGLGGRAAERERIRAWLGKRYEVVVRREGHERTISFTLGPIDRRFWTDPEGLVQLSHVPMAALCLGLAWLIAFRRPDHATARLGALVVACWPAAPLTLHSAPGIVGGLAQLPAPLVALPLIGVVIGVPVFNVATTMLLASFPRALVRGRWVWAPLWLFGALVFGNYCRAAYNFVYAPPDLPMPSLLPRGLLPALQTGLALSWPFVLAWNYRGLEDPSDRRRTRVLVAGLVTSFLVLAFETYLYFFAAHSDRLVTVYWSSPLVVLGALLMTVGPLAMGYAILRHRVFDVGVILRQGLQYAVARRLLLGLAPLLGVALVADLALHSDQTMAQAFLRRGWLYAALAAAALVAHVKSRSWLPALDRAFFRERYDAQRILRSVLADVRQTTDLGAAASRAVSQIDAALHPEFAAILVRRPEEPAFHVAASSGPLSAPPEIRTDGKLMALVRVLGKPVELSQSDTGWLRRQLPGEETDGLARARVEWIFPIALGADRAEGLLVLAPKRSEEPYTQEDQDLVEGIASGLAVVAERTTLGAPSRAEKAVSETAETAVLRIAERYVVRRELGRGGMGAVYQAHDTELDRDVAVKVIRPEHLESAEALSRFKREARAAAGLTHPNVVTVHDFGVGPDGRAYLVMELLDGETLRDAMARDGRFSPARARAVLHGVCAAVEVAHARHVIHRDLKPENVFLVSAGDTEIPKVLDFGVAKALDTGERSASRADTGTGQIVGTLAYMSPEQLQGCAPEPAWDLWALAVVAYEVLAAAHPFAGAGMPVHAAVLAGRATPVSSHLGEEGRRFDAFFAHALAAEQRERPATARELFERFENAATG